MEQTTVWYKSKTIQLGVILFIGSLLQHFGIIELEISPEATWVTSVLSFIQILLRTITKTPVATKSE